MNINKLVMDQYQNGCFNIDINKEQKTNVLENFLKFLNDKIVLNQNYFFADSVAINLDKLSLYDKHSLPNHNKNITNYKEKNNQIFQQELNSNFSLTIKCNKNIFDFCKYINFIEFNITIFLIHNYKKFQNYLKKIIKDKLIIDN